MATLRLVRAAERAGARAVRVRLGDGGQPRSRRRASSAPRRWRGAPVRGRGLDTVVFSPSIVYTPGDPWLTLLERLALLPAMPISGSGRRLFQPIWAEDVADCVVAALERPAGAAVPSSTWPAPQSLSYDDIVRDRAAPARAGGGRWCTCRCRSCAARCALLERLAGPRRFATWEEAELMEEPMTTSRGTADAEALGVNPLRMSAVLGAA